jgi:hypothetical protein
MAAAAAVAGGDLARRRDNTTMTQQAGLGLLAVRHRGPKETRGGGQEEALTTPAVPGTGVEVGEVQVRVGVKAAT